MEDFEPTKCPINPDLECVDCRMKDYVSNQCVYFGIRDAILLVAQEIHALRTHEQTGNPATEAAFTIGKKLAETALVEHNRCREVELMTRDGDIPF